MRGRSFLSFLVLVLSQFFCNITCTSQVDIIEPVGESMMVAPGDEIEVVCKANSGLNIGWKHKGVHVQRLTDYRDRYNTMKTLDTEDHDIEIHTLVIANAHSGDSGTIECVDMGNLFTDKDSIQLIVAVNELFKSQLILTPSDSSHNLVVGREFHLSCSGGQDSDVRWMKDGVVLEETAARPVVEKEDATFSTVLLTFLSVSEDDAGTYKCTDERGKWRDSPEINIRVIHTLDTPSSAGAATASILLVTLSLIFTIGR